MKICIVTDAWHPQINGVVTTLSRTADTLRSWGHEVLVITPERFATLPCPTYPEIRLSLVSPASIQKMFHDFQPDAVHIATEGPLGWCARSACKRLRLDFTTSYHTRFPEYLRMRAPVPMKMSYSLMRGFHGAARRTMAAPTILNELQARDFDHLVPWSRGVDTSLFRPRQRKNSNKPVFLYMGRVAVEKNLPAFLDLDLPGEKRVIGGGPALAAMRARYPEVQFTGPKQGEELACALAEADVFVFPSLTDTFGVVLLEALASGVPVAAYPVTGPKYIVREGVNGCLDTDLRSAALRALTVSREGCRSFASEYSWDTCTSQFLENLAPNRRTAPVHAHSRAGRLLRLRAFSSPS